MKFIDIPLIGQEPEYAHEHDAGADLVALESVIVYKRGGFGPVRTGTSINIPPGYEAQIRPRSGLACKKAVTVLNAPGTIDAGYTGEVEVVLINLGPDDFIIEPGDKIAQLVVQEVVRARFVRVSFHQDTERNTGGFGSTDIVKEN